VNIYSGVKMKKEQDQIDSLFSEIKLYRQTSSYLQLISFISKCTTLGAYNCMLVYTQNPDVKLAMTASKWKNNFKRGIRDTAKPMVTLTPFRPISWVYDFKDTYNLEPDLFNAEEETFDYFLNRYNSLFEPPDKINPVFLSNALSAMPFYGIYVDTTIKDAPTSGGYIQLSSEKVIEFTAGKKTITRKSSYIIRINQRASDEAQLMTIIHELGHLLMHHVAPPSDFENKWEIRLPHHPLIDLIGVPANKNMRETEAEIIKELVCSRLGINDHHNAVFYLAGYNDFLDMNELNIEMICKAVDEIERILKGKLKWRDGLLAKQISEIRRAVTSPQEKQE